MRPLKSLSYLSWPRSLSCTPAGGLTVHNLTLFREGPFERAVRPGQSPVQPNSEPHLTRLRNSFGVSNWGFAGLWKLTLRTNDESQLEKLVQLVQKIYYIQ